MRRWRLVVVSAAWLAVKILLVLLLMKAGGSRFVYQNF
jgi:hypothetical protein